MKKFLTVAFLVAAIFVCGCGGTSYSEEVFIPPHAAWVENKAHVDDFLDAIETHDKDFLEQQIIDKKVKFIEKGAYVTVMDELNDGKIAQIKFNEGRNKNKVGYTYSEYLLDFGKTKAQEKERVAQEQARLAKMTDDEKRQYESLIQNGVQIDLTTVESLSGGYRKLNFKTNLPDDMKLMIILSNKKFVRSETNSYTGQAKITVKHGEFSALFSGTNFSEGDYMMNISSPANAVQPERVKLILGDNGTTLSGAGVVDEGSSGKRIDFSEEVLLPPRY